MKICLINDTHRGMSNNTDKIHAKFFVEVARQDFDVLIHAGDAISAGQRRLKRAWEQLREAAGDRPVLAVRGNHDYWQDEHWDKSKWRNFYDLLSSHQALADNYNITLLDEDFGTYETDEILIGGFTTWYKESNPATNDGRWMDALTPAGEWVGDFLRNREYRQLGTLHGQLMWAAGKVRIAVSHMPIFGTEIDQKYTSRYSNQLALKSNCEHYICGHSHRRYEGTEEFGGGVKVWQTGSDYDKPKFMIIDTETGTLV